jgi:putative tricarboxylic transport membrane protein
MGNSLMETFKFKRAAAVGSGFGLLMGMIPRIDKFTAQFLGYTSVRRRFKRSKHLAKAPSKEWSLLKVQITPCPLPP